MIETELCGDCQGDGFVEVIVGGSNETGPITRARKCSECDGSGEVPESVMEFVRRMHARLIRQATKADDGQIESVTIVGLLSVLAAVIAYDEFECQDGELREVIERAIG